MNPLTGPAWVGVALVAAATVVGALLARRAATRPVAANAAAAGVLLAVVLGDLVPDIWHDLPDVGLPWWAAPAAGAAGVLAASALVRRGCACEPGGTGTPPAGTGGALAGCLAIAAHRALEGSTLAVAASIPLIAALVVHAAVEGFVLAGLPGAGRADRRVVLWLAVACASPAVGAAALGAVDLPDSAHVLVTSALAGVLLRAALGAYPTAALRTGTRHTARPLATATLTAAVLAGALLVLTR
jgi:ZIP family zinc transporter